MKKLLALFCCLLLCAPAFAVDIRLDLEDISVYDSIYLGEYEGNPIEWIVLDQDNTSMNTPGKFLLAKDILSLMPLNSIDYASSGLPGKCEDVAETAFSAFERSLLVETDVAASGSYRLDGDFTIVYDSAVNGGELFIPSVTEIRNYIENSSLMDVDEDWFTRSTTPLWDGGLLVIDKNGFYNYTSYYENDYSRYDRGFRPAANIKIDGYNTAFISPAVGGETGLGLQPVQKQPNVSAWKLKLWNPNARFSASCDKETVYSDDKTIPVRYRSEDFGENGYVSAILIDDARNIISYGAVQKIEASDGEVTIALPDNLENGTYRLTVFCEQRNGDYRSDVIGTPIGFEFELVNNPFVPPTGDGANIALWVCLLAASAAGMFIFSRKVKTNR